MVLLIDVMVEVRVGNVLVGKGGRIGNEWDNCWINGTCVDSGGKIKGE